MEVNSGISESPVLLSQVDEVLFYLTIIHAALTLSCLLLLLGYIPTTYYDICCHFPVYAHLDTPAICDCSCVHLSGEDFNATPCASCAAWIHLGSNREGTVHM